MDFPFRTYRRQQQESLFLYEKRNEKCEKMLKNAAINDEVATNTRVYIYTYAHLLFIKIMYKF